MLVKLLFLLTPLFFGLLIKSNATQTTTITTQSGILVPIIFSDRASDSLILLGQGLGGAKEELLLLGKAFPEYDTICFDYRWKTDPYFFFWPSTLNAPIEKIFFDCQEELCAVYSFITKQKNYKKIIGLGTCYSAALFILAQVQHELRYKTPLFTHLICDSMWLCINDLICRMNKQYPLLTSSLISLLSSLVPEYCTDKYLVLLSKTATLFIHGANDQLVPLSDFALIVAATKNTPKECWITDYGHGESFLSDQRAYVQVCQTFIEKFSDTASSPLVTYN
jgi:hypothetical protein